MATLKIYRSSAGAGKTHTLVSAYLKLALESLEAFTQILAVTFTNQATQEMKHRILVYLHDLAQGMPNALSATLLREGRWDKDTLQVRARAVLSAILHQYTRFSVSTIDSFLQKVIRGFAQELGLQSKFRVELEQAPVLEKLIDDLVIAAGHDEQLQQWLVAFAEDKLLNGKQWNLKRDLTGLGYEIFKESFGVYEAPLVAATSDRAALQHLLERLHACIGYFETHLQGLGQQALQAIQRAGLEVSDFAYGKAGAAGYLTGLATKRQWTPTLRALRALGHVPMWYARASDKQQEIACVVQDHLQPCLQAVVQFYDTHHRTYYAALAVKHFVYALGIVTQLLERLNDYRATYNVMLVSDTTQFLRKIIAENETPFVYEKIGAFYKHFLIDEFQDVSGAQWHSFQPLIENGLNEGHESMVVGDVKQSIYRWRGGDWRLLLSQLEKDVRQTAAVSLDQNWRSKPHIVAFNNAFFTAAAKVLVQHFTEKLEAIEEPALKVDLLAQARQLGSAYEDVHQTVPPQRIQADQGYVKVTLLEGTDGEEQ
ncbi:MAG: UvrD-helicase domain-containing protein, partial [Bacteroidota bacterium]